MIGMTDSNGHQDLGRVRALAWGGAAALILLPLIAMQFTTDVNWGAGGFIFATVLVGGVGAAFELAVRISSDWTYRAGTALALVTGFILTWGNLAVGFIGSEDNPLNAMYFGVVAIALVGSFAARFRAKGMATAMASAAAAQVVAAGVALYHGHFTIPLTIMFAALWLASARLFLRSAG